MDASDLILIFSFVFKYSPHRGLLYLLGSSWILVSRVCYSYMRFLLWITPFSFYFDSWSLFTSDVDISHSTCELGWYSLLVLKYLYSCSPDSNWACVSWDTLVSGFPAVSLLLRTWPLFSNTSIISDSIARVVRIAIVRLLQFENRLFGYYVE